MSARWLEMVAALRRARRSTPHPGLAALLCSAIAVGTSAGCSADAGTPAAVVNLPEPQSVADLTDASRSVSLSVGQSVAVQFHRSDVASRWKQVDGGDAAVLTSDGEDIIKACAAGTAGCGPTVQDRYLAQARGTTTIEWDYLGMGPGPLPAGVSDVACPSFGATARCPVGTMKIVVTVT